MIGHFKSVALAGAILLFGNELRAQAAPPQGIIHCQASAIDQQTIKEGQLLIKLSRFKYRSFKVSVQNTSESFGTFSPADLIIVGNDGSQNYIETSYSTTPLHPTSIRVAPMAHVLLTYGLNTEINLPAKIYYSEKLVAVITK